MKGHLKRSQENLKYKDVIRRVLGLSGIMFLFGLTWLFAALTIDIDGNQLLRIVFQALFVVSASFQGFFIFLFLCVLKKEARDSWKEAFCCGKLKQRYKYSFTGSGVTNSNTKTNTIGSSSRGLYDSVNVKGSILKIKSDTIPRNEPSKEDIFTEIPLSEIKDEREDINAHFTTFTGNDQPVQVISETKINDHSEFGDNCGLQVL